MSNLNENEYSVFINFVLTRNWYIHSNLYGTIEGLKIALSRYNSDNLFTVTVAIYSSLREYPFSQLIQMQLELAQITFLIELFFVNNSSGNRNNPKYPIYFILFLSLAHDITQIFGKYRTIGNAVDSIYATAPANRTQLC